MKKFSIPVESRKGKSYFDTIEMKQDSETKRVKISSSVTKVTLVKCFVHEGYNELPDVSNQSLFRKIRELLKRVYNKKLAIQMEIPINSFECKDYLEILFCFEGSTFEVRFKKEDFTKKTSSLEFKGQLRFPEKVDKHIIENRFKLKSAINRSIALITNGNFTMDVDKLVFCSSGDIQVCEILEAVKSGSLEEKDTSKLKILKTVIMEM